MGIWKKIWEKGPLKDEGKETQRPKPSPMPDYSDIVRNARRNAKLECEKCGGTGEYQYDENHWTICPKCCQHNMDWFQMGEEYGKQNEGKWCCKAGCGLVIDKFEKTILEWNKIDEKEKRDMDTIPLPPSPPGPRIVKDGELPSKPE